MQRIRQRGVEVYTMSHIPDKERNRGTTKQIVESASDQEWQAVVEVSRSTRTLNWELWRVGGCDATTTCCRHAVAPGHTREEKKTYRETAGMAAATSKTSGRLRARRTARTRHPHDRLFVLALLLLV